MAVCDLSTLEADACTNKFMQVAQDEQLFRAILLQIACNLTSGGGGGGGGVTSGNGPPVAAPSGSAGIYFDLLTGVQYNYYDGSWH